MNKLLKSLLVAGVCLTVISCSKSNETTAGGNNNGGGTPGGGTGGGSSCDTVNMKYAANIAPIIQANCFSCHSNSTMTSSGSNISLEGHANLKKKVDDGRLMGAITHASGFVPMPKDGAKLSDCNINKIKDWIDRGAQNN